MFMGKPARNSDQIATFAPLFAGKGNVMRLAVGY